jgi:hypothetical protein
MWPQAPTPIAWGWINGNGKPDNATPNVTSRWVEEIGYYDIAIAKEAITPWHLTFIQLRGGQFNPSPHTGAIVTPRIGVVDSSRLSIQFVDGQPDHFYRSLDGFAFIIYPPARA